MNWDDEGFIVTDIKPIKPIKPIEPIAPIAPIEPIEKKKFIRKKTMTNSELRLEQINASIKMKQQIAIDTKPIRSVKIIKQQFHTPLRVISKENDENDENDEKLIVNQWVKKQLLSSSKNEELSLACRNLESSQREKIKKIKKIKTVISITPLSLITQRHNERKIFLQEKCKEKCLQNADYSVHYTKRTLGFGLLSNKEEMKTKLIKRKMCISTINKTTCPHGSRCRYAHTLSELCNDCMFGTSCKLVRKKEGNFENREQKICLYIHPDETIENFTYRTKSKIVESKIVESKIIESKIIEFVNPPLKQTGWLAIMGVKKSRWGIITKLKKNRWGDIPKPLKIRVSIILVFSILKTLFKLGYKHIEVETY